MDAIKGFCGFKVKTWAVPVNSVTWDPPGSGSEKEIITDPRYKIEVQDLPEIHRAAWSGKVKKVQQLLQRKTDLNLRDKHLRTPLHLACANGNLGVVRLLLNNNCHYNVCDDENRTPLMKAVQCQFKECVELLLLKGADPNMIDCDGNTALHYAACGKVTIASQLLFHEADIEARNKHDLTPLLLAINENNEEMVIFLIQNYADVHAVDRDKRTALMFAVKHVSKYTIRILFRTGINVFARDRYGWRADDYAAFCGINTYKEIINDYIEDFKKKHPEEYEKIVKSEQKRFPLQLLKRTRKPIVKEISKDTSRGLSKECGPSGADIFGLEPKVPPKPNLVKSLPEFQQSKKQDVETTNVISLRESTTEDSHCSGEGEHGSKAIPKGGITIKVGSYPTNDGSDSHDKGVSVTLPGTIKVTEEETELEPKEDKGNLALSKVPATVQTKHPVTAMDKNQKDVRSRLRSQEEHQRKICWISESAFKRSPQKNADDLAAAPDIQERPDSPMNNLHLKTLANDLVLQDVDTSQSEFSDLHSASVSRKLSKKSNIDDEPPSKPPAQTTSHSTSAKCGRTTLARKVKDKSGVEFLTQDDPVDDQSKAEPSENKRSREVSATKHRHLKGTKDASPDQELAPKDVHTSNSDWDSSSGRQTLLKKSNIDDEPPCKPPAPTSTKCGRTTIAQREKDKSGAEFVAPGVPADDRGKAEPSEYKRSRKDSEMKRMHFKDTRDATPDQELAPKEVHASKSDFSDWDSSSGRQTFPKKSKVDDEPPSKPPAPTTLPSTSTKCGRTTIAQKEKDKSGVEFVTRDIPANDDWGNTEPSEYKRNRKDSATKHQHLKDTKHAPPDQDIAPEDLHTSVSDFSDWDSSSGRQTLPKKSDIDNGPPCKPPALTTSHSTSAKCGRMTLPQKEKDITGAEFVTCDDPVDDLAKAGPSECKRSRKDPATNHRHLKDTEDAYLDQDLAPKSQHASKSDFSDWDSSSGKQTLPKKSDIENGPPCKPPAPTTSHSISAKCGRTTLPQKEKDITGAEFVTCVDPGEDLARAGPSEYKGSRKDLATKPRHLKDTKDAFPDQDLAPKDQHISKSDFSDWDSSSGRQSLPKKSSIDDGPPCKPPAPTTSHSTSAKCGRTTLPQKEKDITGAKFVTSDVPVDDLARAGPSEYKRSRKDSATKHRHLKDTKDAYPDQDIAPKDQNTTQSDFSDWDSSSGRQSLPKKSSIDDGPPCKPPAPTTSHSTSAKCGRTTLPQKEKDITGAKFVTCDDPVDDLARAGPSEYKRSRKDSATKPRHLKDTKDAFPDQDLAPKEQHTSKSDFSDWDSSSGRQSLPKKSSIDDGPPCKPPAPTTSHSTSAKCGRTTLPQKEKDITGAKFVTSDVPVDDLARAGPSEYKRSRKDSATKPRHLKDTKDAFPDQDLAPKEQHTSKSDFSDWDSSSGRQSLPKKSSIDDGPPCKPPAPTTSHSTSAKCGRTTLPQKEKDITGAKFVTSDVPVDDLARAGPSEYKRSRKDSATKPRHLKDTKDAFPDQDLAPKEQHTSKSDFSDWDSSSGRQSLPKKSSIDDGPPCKPPAPTTSHSTSAKCGRTTLPQKEKDITGAKFVTSDVPVDDLARAGPSEYKRSRKDSATKPRHLKDTKDAFPDQDLAPKEQHTSKSDFSDWDSSSGRQSLPKKSSIDDGPPCKPPAPTTSHSTSAKCGRTTLPQKEKDITGAKFVTSDVPVDDLARAGHQNTKGAEKDTKDAFPDQDLAPKDQHTSKSDFSDWDSSSGRQTLPKKSNVDDGPPCKPPAPTTSHSTSAKCGRTTLAQKEKDITGAEFVTCDDPMDDLAKAGPSQYKGSRKDSVTKHRHLKDTKDAFPDQDLAPKEQHTSKSDLCSPNASQKLSKKLDIDDHHPFTPPSQTTDQLTSTKGRRMSLAEKEKDCIDVEFVTGDIPVDLRWKAERSETKRGRKDSTMNTLHLKAPHDASSDEDTAPKDVTTAKPDLRSSNVSQKHSKKLDADDDHSFKPLSQTRNKSIFTQDRRVSSAEKEEDNMGVVTGQTLMDPQWKSERSDTKKSRKDASPDIDLAPEDVHIPKPDFPDSGSPRVSQERARKLDVDDPDPFKPTSQNTNEATSTKWRRMALAEKERDNIEVVLITEDTTVHNMGKAERSEEPKSRKGSTMKSPHLKAIKDASPDIELAPEDVHTPKPDWNSPRVSKALSKKLNADDQGPSKSTSPTTSQPTLTKYRMMTLAEKEKDNFGIVCITEDELVHNIGKAEYPEHRKSRKSLIFKMSSKKKYLSAECKDNKSKTQVPLEPEKKRGDNVIPRVQPRSSLQTHQGKGKLKHGMKTIKNVVKQTFSDMYTKYKSMVHTKGEPVPGNSKENQTSSTSSSKERDDFEVATSVIFQREPSLENVLSSTSSSGSDTSTSQSCSMLSLDNEEFGFETDNKTARNKGQASLLCSCENLRNPDEIFFDMKVRQEFHMGRKKSMGKYTSKRKLDIKHEHKPSHQEHHLCPNDMKTVVPAPNHNHVQAQDSFQNQFCRHRSENKYKHGGPQLENVSAPTPDSYETVEINPNENLQQHMQKFLHEISPLQVLQASGKEKVQLQNENPSKEKPDSLPNCPFRVLNDNLQLEIDALKNQIRVKEKKYAEDMEFMKTKNDDLQQNLNRSEEALRRTTFQYSGQLNELTAENARLRSKLKDEMLNKQRLETDIDSLQSRLAAAVQDHERSQKSKGEFELSLPTTRDVCLHIRNKFKTDMSKIKETNDTLGQKLSKMETKFRSLETEFTQTKDTLQEEIVNLQRDVNQSQSQLKETEHRYQNAPEKVCEAKSAEKLLYEQFTRLQAENDSLQQKVHEAENKVDSEEKKVTKLQDQFHFLVKTYHNEREKRQELEERIKELVNMCDLLQGCLCQCEKEKVERKIDPLTGKWDTVYSQWQSLEIKNQALQLELSAMKDAQRKCGKLEKKKGKLEQKVVQLQRELDQKQSKLGQVDQFTWRVEEQTEEAVHELQQVKLILQHQAQSQGHREQLWEEQTASLTREMEQRMKGLEHEFSSQIYSQRAEAEKYKQLYFQELEVKKEFSKKLDKNTERLSEVRANLALEKQQNQTLFNSLVMQQAREASFLGTAPTSSIFHRNLYGSSSHK